MIVACAARTMHPHISGIDTCPESIHAAVTWLAARLPEATRLGSGVSAPTVGRLAQLARAAGLQPAGQRFESSSAHQVSL